MQIFKLLLVCDPVHRIVSRYYHAKDIGGPKVGELGDSFEDYQKNIILAERNTSSVFDSIELNGRDRTTAILEELYVRQYFARAVIHRFRLNASCRSS